MKRLLTLFILLPVFLLAQEYTLFNSDNSDLPENAVYCIDFDQDGNIWFGGQKNAATGIANVSRLSSDLTTWKVFTDAELALDGLEDRVFYMACDDQGTMWFCTHYGVSWLKTDGTSGKVDFTVDQYTRTVEVDPDGKIYISQREDDRNNARLHVSSDHGATWDPMTMQDLGFGISINEGNARPEAYDVKEGSDGQLWICTWYGITKKNTQGTWNSISELDGDYTFALTVDPSNRAWVPISGNLELVKIGPGGSATIYDSTWSKALTYPINDLEADENGTIWLATDGGGLIALQDNGSYVQYDSALTAGEIPEDNLTHMEIKDGVIWASTAAEGIIRISGMITDIEDEKTAAIPEQINLLGNYPNPFNPSTSIKFQLDKNTNVRLDVYDSNGRFITNLINKNYSAGVHSVNWNGTDSKGTKVASGIYYYRFSADKQIQTNKMLLIK